MGQIFSEAKNVCIWLGEATDRSDAEIKFVEEREHIKFAQCRFGFKGS